MTDIDLQMNTTLQILAVSIDMPPVSAAVELQCVYMLLLPELPMLPHPQQHAS